jgi:hypothetical protein
MNEKIKQYFQNCATIDAKLRLRSITLKKFFFGSESCNFNNKNAQTMKDAKMRF